MVIGHQLVLHEGSNSSHVALGVPAHGASTLTHCTLHCVVRPISCCNSD
jgi:hypothetical protein